MAASDLCDRSGCGHAKRAHDLPEYEGMCAAAGCECLQFATPPRVRPVGPVRPVRPVRPVKPAHTKPVRPVRPVPKVPPVAKPKPGAPGDPDKGPRSETTETVAKADAFAQHIQDTTWPASDGGRTEHDPRHGMVDKEIQETVAEMDPVSVGQRVAIENTLQARRDRGHALGVAVARDREPEPIQTPVDLSDETDEIGGDECGDLLPGDESLPLAGNVDPEPMDVGEYPSSTPVDEPVEIEADERFALAHAKHPSGTKRCPHCEQEQRVEDFYPVKSNYDGVHGWCRTCMNARPFTPTLARTLRNRARHRAAAALIQEYPDRFQELYEQLHAQAVEEAQLLADAEAAQGLYSDKTGEHVRLRPGKRGPGESATDRIDVARCPHCIRYHDSGHQCEVCGSKPEHLEVTKTAWAATQEKIRERMLAQQQEAG